LQCEKDSIDRLNINLCDCLSKQVTTYDGYPTTYFAKRLQEPYFLHLNLAALSYTGLMRS